MKPFFYLCVKQMFLRFLFFLSADYIFLYNLLFHYRKPRNSVLLRPILITFEKIDSIICFYSDNLSPYLYKKLFELLFGKVLIITLTIDQ